MTMLPKSKTRFLVECGFESSEITACHHFSPLSPTLSQDHTGFRVIEQVDKVWIVSKGLEKNLNPGHIIKDLKQANDAAQDVEDKYAASAALRATLSQLGETYPICLGRGAACCALRKSSTKQGRHSRLPLLANAPTGHGDQRGAPVAVNITSAPPTSHAHLCESIRCGGIIRPL